MMIGLCGYSGAGKDSVATILIEEHGFARIALGDPLKEMVLVINPMINAPRRVIDKNTPWDPSWEWMRLADYHENVCGGNWDLTKQHPEVRRLLQATGTEGVRNIIDDNAWIDLCYGKRVVAVRRRVVITDIRFPNEANRHVRQGGRLWRLHRDFDNGVDRNHESERHVPDLPAQLELYNDGTKEQLSQKVREALRREYKL